MVKTNYIQVYSMVEGYVSGSDTQEVIQNHLAEVQNGHYKKIHDDEKMTIWTLVEDHNGDDVDRGIYNVIGLKGWPVQDISIEFFIVDQKKKTLDK